MLRFYPRAYFDELVFETVCNDIRVYQAIKDCSRNTQIVLSVL